MTKLSIGDRVKVERDEKKYRSKGTWKWYRGKTGFIVEVNRSGRWEYGVSFTASPRTEAWFKAYELMGIE